MFGGPLKRRGRSTAEASAERSETSAGLSRIDARFDQLSELISAQADLLRTQGEAISAIQNSISPVAPAAEDGPDAMVIELEGLAPFPFTVHPSGNKELVSDIIRERGDWETLETEICRRLLPHYDLFLDLGANIGWYSTVAKQAMRPGGTVHAFEPDPTNFALLRKNVGRCGAVQVHLVPAGVSETVGSASLFHSAVNFGDHRLYQSEEERSSIAVPVTTLDAYFGGCPLPPCLCKMDTQGSEPRIFRGAQSVLPPSEARTAFLIEFWPHGMSNSGETAAAFADVLSTYPQQPYVIDIKLNRQWPELVRRSENEMAPATRGFVDLLMVTPGSAAHLAVVDLINPS